MGLGKLLVFILVIYVAWRLGRALIGPLMNPTVSERDSGGNPKVQDMQECSVCGTYVTANSKRCERFDCPR